MGSVVDIDAAPLTGTAAAAAAVGVGLRAVHAVVGASLQGPSHSGKEKLVKRKEKMSKMYIH